MQTRKHPGAVAAANRGVGGAHLAGKHPDHTPSLQAGHSSVGFERSFVVDGDRFIRIAANFQRGAWIIDVRLWRRGHHGDVPTRRGVSIPAACGGDIAAAVQAVASWVSGAHPAVSDDDATSVASLACGGAS